MEIQYCTRIATVQPSHKLCFLDSANRHRSDLNRNKRVFKFKIHCVFKNSITCDAEIDSVHVFTIIVLVLLKKV
jgi:hypothetical protein